MFYERCGINKKKKLEILKKRSLIGRAYLEKNWLPHVTLRVIGRMIQIRRRFTLQKFQIINHI